MQKAVDKYKKENFPENLGLLSAMVLVRKHNEKDVSSVGEEMVGDDKNIILI